MSWTYPMLSYQQASLRTSESYPNLVTQGSYEILRDGVVKEWSYDNNCFIYRVGNDEKKKRQMSLKSLIAHYYKLK